MKRGEDLRILIPELTDYAFKAVALEDAVISSRAKTHAPVAYIYIYISSKFLQSVWRRWRSQRPGREVEAAARREWR